MSKPWDHARISVRKWGGVIQDYLPIHDKMDSSKIAHPTMKHRCIFHSGFGCYLIEDIFGHNITNSDGRLVSTREIVEQHILDDHQFIPSLDDWLRCMTLEPWMGNPTKIVKQHILGE